MKSPWMFLAAAGLCVVLPSAPAAAADGQGETSLRYSRLVYVGPGGPFSVGGWQLSAAEPFQDSVDLVLDIGGCYADDLTLHTVMGGLRLKSRDREGPRVFVQLLGGLAIGGGFLFHPGVGVDFGPVRLQVDWPLLTPAYGAIFSLPRISAGLTFRQGRR